ncbi:Sigma54 specific transcriptional regulator, Fis family [Tepidanaerobacter acetatoxydans Re1]|uniref:Sigma54 specific transcriptional regulator, Fis family n=1 Tax=Tepidanaerobacter acetatoxydans (strain DSM 21804 / JCM 16047 / Re1) TaxID=1209989 RepID=F4LUN0_TEPAE|nr:MULTISPECIES: sigma 54-interacting transcriptional regulator [Tepidanaerobacter]AEE90598.1 sigma54 specific transcriptional regulator, Fis family [Tepidanaerobacter acetatoxydans Re1]CDI40375.1 Sigma54 specific transcriptional regulator, Fis family [Tepidanaerobacter acetatoxydans Re1]
MNANLQEILIDCLEVLARITGGYATVTDRDGVRLKTVDSSGNEIESLKGVVFGLAKKAAQTGKAISGMSQLEDGAESWCLPISEYVLACSNIERVKRNNDLKLSLIESLPFIARVAGGEAVVFDSQGKRIATVDSKGNTDHKNLGLVSKGARESMIKQKPVIGESSSVSGAMAVRIPITKEFGFGFNNEEMVRRSNKLVSEVRKHQTAKYNFSDIIGESPAMRKLKETAKLAAKSNSNVLIYGETGTGKELFAHSIHNASERHNKPFVAINCAALPPTLIESELFGYESGAFTGAKKGGHPGVFEQANGGTLFLDEISEMDIDLQAKLLRVLQEREVTRLGGRKAIPLDVRVIASTNKPLDKMVKDGKFRQDLFFRLNVFDIKLVPLRQIREDIPLIASEIVKKMNVIFGKYVEKIDDEATRLLMQYDWPGNVRELVNCLEKAFNILGNDKYITKDHLSFKFNMDDIGDASQGLSAMLADYEKKVIEKVLKETKGVKVQAAKILGISTTTLWRKIKELNIEV